jgi:hypothetical protein
MPDLMNGDWKERGRRPVLYRVKKQTPRLGILANTKEPSRRTEAFVNVSTCEGHLDIAIRHG